MNRVAPVNSLLLAALLLGAVLEASWLGTLGILSGNALVIAAAAALVAANRRFDPLPLVLVLTALGLLALSTAVNIDRLGPDQIKAVVLTAAVLPPFALRLRALDRRLALRLVGWAVGAGMVATLGLVAAGVSLAPFVAEDPGAYAGEPLAMGLFANPNRASHFYLLVLLLALAFAPGPRLRWSTVGAALALIFISQARATLGGAGIALAVYFLLHPDRPRPDPRRWRAILVVPLGLALGLAAFAAVWPGAIGDLAQKIANAGLSYRLTLWRLATEALTADPMTVLLGQGANTVALPLGDTTVTAHSAFLDTAVNLGLPYLLVVVLLTLAVTVQAWTGGERRLALMVAPLLAIGGVASVLFAGAYPLWVLIAWTRLLVAAPAPRRAPCAASSA